jgi:chemosensory pili system protein ChpA (sensor histidine kinase/response regulator)
MTELATQTLHMVAREISVALADGRGALEEHVEQPGNMDLLERCRLELHQVQGVLRLLEIYGAALLAEEMEQVARYLIGLGGERKNQDEALDALMRSMVQLPGYLERVIAGGRDLALVLLPLLNDLRAVRGSALLSEGTLLLLNLKSDRQAQPASPAPGEAPLSVGQWARRLRARYQTGLIGWIRGERTEQNLEIMAAVATRLEQVAATQPVFQLWWVVGALIEALRESGIDGSISVKRLLGLADREIKRLFDQGEARYAQHPPVELLNNLLYYIARSGSGGPRVAAVRASFRLNELLPVDESIEQERENLSAPSIKLMHTVAAAIREDLAKVKDVMDIYVRRGGGQAEELVPQVAMLKKIGDTLGVLGLGGLRSRVQEATGRLEGIIGGSEANGESALVQVAAALIKVEDHLDDDLVGLILPRSKAAADGESPDQDFQQVQGAVLRECVVNLARIKEYVSQNVSGTLDAAGFDNWPELMRGINAGLLMLGKSRAVEIIEEITTHLKRVMQPGGSAFSPDYLDRLADAIVSLEYYIETLQAGRSDPWYMLDNARSCLDALKRAPERAPPPTVSAATTGSYARTQLIDRSTRLGDTTDIRRLDPTATAPPVLAAAAAIAAPNRETSPDPDLIELFIEEAKEELAKIEQQFPIWDHSPLAGEALLVVRRSFHTLKGSGRMVNARAISEFAWAIENLLNRILDGTLQRSPGVLQTLRSAIAGLPQLIAELESGNPNRADLAPLAARAHALASGREDMVGTALEIPAAAPAAAAALAASAATAPAATPAAAEPLPAQLPAEAPLEAEPEPDAALREIYARETASHVALVRGWLARERRLGGPHVLPEEVYRACHTLAGSSTMAEVRHGIRLADPMNHWLRKAFDSGIGLDDSDLILLGDCMVAMEAVAGHLDERTGFFVMHDTLRGRIARAELDLDRRIAEANEFTGRSSISLQVPANLLEPPAGPAPPVELGPPIAPESQQAAPEPPSLAPSPPPPVAATVPIVPPAMDTRDADHAEFDPDIAAIFSEEAVELLEAAESALAAWNTKPDDADQVAALRRPLHTLKGGARMAGIDAMGELAHELESLVGRIELGAASADEAARGVVQQALDELARMREAIASGRPAAAAAALITRIQSVAATERAVPSVVPQPVVPQPVAPPQVASTVPSVDAGMLSMPEPEWHPDPLLQDEPEFQPAPEWQPSAAAEPEPEPEPPPEETVVMPASAIPPPAVLHPAPLPLPPAPLPPGREPVLAADRVDMARVSAELLDQLLNNAGEVSVSRARLEQQLGSIEFNLGELSRTVTRLKEQLRKLEMETEAQILHRHENETGHRQQFDPLELDRYSSIQQFSRALAESANDVASIQGLLESLIAEAQNLLQQQSRTVTELQNGLMRTRMVSVQRHVQRLARIVRQAASDTGKRAELIVEGASGELDRQVLERMLPPFEHMLRNAVVHGIESPAERIAAGKDESGHIHLSLKREGAEVVVEVRDDGAGMNLADAAGRSRRRHGRGRRRGQEARRRAAHGEHAGPRHALHHPPAVHARDQPCAGGAHRR